MQRTEDYYEGWLSLWAKSAEARKSARRVIHAEELKWVRTRQDHSSALVVSPETGFKTFGSVTMLGEIPPRWKTGRHAHGEEGMYIIGGKGFSVIGDKRYDWEEGACIRIPFGTPHQHFNDGDAPVRYYSALAPHLENQFSLCKFEHFEDCGQRTAGDESGLPRYAGDRDPKGQRLVLHMKEARATQEADKEKNIWFMGKDRDFTGKEIEITNILIDPNHITMERHAHMEAILYFLEGEGYTVVDGEKVPWKAGSALHVQGPQTVHQHFTTGSTPSRQLRTHLVIRKYLQDLAEPVFPYLHHLEGDDFLKPF